MRFLKLWHQLTCRDVATEIAQRNFPRMQKSRKKKTTKKKKEVQRTEPDGAGDTHLSLRHFTRELFSTRLGRTEVKPEGPEKGGGFELTSEHGINI